MSNYSIKELQQAITERGGEVDDCRERSDLVQRLNGVLATRSSQGGGDQALRVGDMVVRSESWEFGDQDGGAMENLLNICHHCNFNILFIEGIGSRGMVYRLDPDQQ